MGTIGMYFYKYHLKLMTCFRMRVIIFMILSYPVKNVFVQIFMSFSSTALSCKVTSVKRISVVIIFKL